MSNPVAAPTRSRWLVPVILLVGALSGAVPLWSWLQYRFTHSISKDAFIETHLINIAPQVPGTVVAVHVQEQDRVRKGDLLALVDPSTYQREVELAAAKQTVAEAALARAEADLALLVEEVPKRVVIAEKKQAIAVAEEARAHDALAMTTRDVNEAMAAARHAVERAKATFTLADEDYQRYTALLKEGSVTERRLQEATSTHRTSRAEVQIAEARLGQAEANRKQIGIAEQQLKASQHAVAEAQAAVELARLGNQEIVVSRQMVAERAQAVAEARRNLELARTKLGYTRIVAPYDGIIARKWRHLGDYAGTGEPIFSMYNPDLLYVTVQLEETLLEGVAPGNPATLQVEAYRQPFKGRVLWIGSATSANFSLIPRDISSGEFTYVVQRIPTRIAIERDKRWSLLRPGLSVTVAISHGAGDPEWARQALQQEAEIEGVQRNQQ